MDEIEKQARQGSVAAIVQILNDRLADMGVRTRAVLESGILQVLCEAKQSEKLEQSVLISNLKAILEEIKPQNIYRVSIRSRIAKEQQLVWLEDIHRNPENQILWSQEIMLRRPNPLQNLTGARQALGMTALCVACFFAGLAWRSQNIQIAQLRELLPFTQSNSSVSPAAGIVSPNAAETLSPALQTDEDTPNTVPSSPTSAATPTPTTVLLPTPGNSPATDTPQQSDPFAEAVRLAEEVSLKGQTAKTEAEWLKLSAQWQKTSDLMKAVSQEDPRYSTARDRVVFYQKNSEVARARAKEQEGK